MTLIELLIVMIIIVILSVVVTTNLTASISGVQSDDDKVKSWSGTITYDKDVVNIMGANPGAARSLPFRPSNPTSLRS